MNIKDKIKNIPCEVGIYIMKDAYDNIIYVGKSKNLNNRVKSYFRSSLNRSRKIERMVTFIKDIEFITTDTELDALLLECKYIHKYRPMYNTLMNNYEKYKYIKLDKNSNSIINIVDNIEDNGIYFGPFSMNRSLNDLKEFLSDIFKLPICKSRTKCIRYDIDKCLGPCRVDVVEKYEEIYNIIKDTFEGKDYFLEKLNTMMRKEAEKLNFEKSLLIKKYIDLIYSIRKQHNTYKNLYENPQMILWISLNEKEYKIYYINNIDVLYTKIIDSSNINEEIIENIKSDIRKCKVKENSSIYYDKSYIDYLNIIYGYINSSKEINHLILK